MTYIVSALVSRSRAFVLVVILDAELLLNFFNK